MKKPLTHELGVAVEYTLNHPECMWYNMGYIHGMRMLNALPDWMDYILYKNRENPSTHGNQDLHDLYWAVRSITK